MNQSGQIVGYEKRTDSKATDRGYRLLCQPSLEMSLSLPR
jgi:hypothetical protein